MAQEAMPLVVPATPAPLPHKRHARDIVPRYTCPLFQNDCGGGFCCTVGQTCANTDGRAVCQLPPGIPLPDIPANPALGVLPGPPDPPGPPPPSAPPSATTASSSSPSSTTVTRSFSSTAITSPATAAPSSSSTTSASTAAPDSSTTTAAAESSTTIPPSSTSTTTSPSSSQPTTTATAATPDPQTEPSSATPASATAASSTSSPPPSSSSTAGAGIGADGSGSTRVSGPGIAGIVVGLGAFALLLGGAVYFSLLLRRRRRRRRNRERERHRDAALLAAAAAPGSGSRAGSSSSSSSESESARASGEDAVVAHPAPPWRQRWQQGPRRAAGGRAGATEARDWQEAYARKDRSSGLAYMYGGAEDAPGMTAAAAAAAAGPGEETRGRAEVEGDHVRQLSGDTGSLPVAGGRARGRPGGGEAMRSLARPAAVARKEVGSGSRRGRRQTFEMEGSPVAGAKP